MIFHSAPAKRVIKLINWLINYARCRTLLCIEDIIILFGTGDISVVATVVSIDVVSSVVELVDVVLVSVSGIGIGIGRGGKLLAVNFSPFIKEFLICSNIPAGGV